MAIKHLYQDSSEQSSPDKPLLRNWCKDEIKAERDPYEQPLVVRCLKESRDGKWVVTELDSCVALIPAKSSIGLNLLDLMPQLKGEGNALVIIPHKKGKLGFSVGVDDETKVYYKWNEDDEYLWATNKHIPKKQETPAITLDALLGSTSPQTSESAKSGRTKSKTPPNNAESDAKQPLEGE